MASDAPFRAARLERIAPGGARESLERSIAVEAAVAVEVGGLGYAVMMATPADLEDFAYGFARSERLIDSAEEVRAVDAHETPRGFILRITVVPERMDRVVERVRHRATESACGLCGIENLDQALRPLPHLPAGGARAGEAAVFRALEGLSAHQPLNARTGAVHAAALCSAAGEVRLAREDVGRHNAFDKLIGAMIRQGLDWDGGFALLTSRCSYDLVEKAALAGCPMLATLSAPTSLAVEQARAAGLKLVVLARPDAVLSLAPDDAI